MRVINARNVNDALAHAVGLMRNHGQLRGSRNGKVLTPPFPVTTVYSRPCERVLFSPARDANPFFHLYESLWMLAGRNDVAPLVKYTKQIGAYSDDGLTIHDAYGYRWREHFQRNHIPIDQLRVIIVRLQKDKDDRRCVLQMWDTLADLGNAGKAVPCNLTATFQVQDGLLNMVVFCRSNDIIWGCYGANAVHFSFLLEYVASKIGVPVGTYTQVSVNWHAYTEHWGQVRDIQPGVNPYVRFVDTDTGQSTSVVRHIPIAEPGSFDHGLSVLLAREEQGFPTTASSYPSGFQYEDDPWNVWWNVVYAVLAAHSIWRDSPYPQRTELALNVLSRPEAPQDADWIVAARQWIERRHKRWEKRCEDRQVAKQASEMETLGHDE